jgi:hypothetical protein
LLPFLFLDFYSLIGYLLRELKENGEHKLPARPKGPCFCTLDLGPTSAIPSSFPKETDMKFPMFFLLLSSASSPLEDLLCSWRISKPNIKLIPSVWMCNNRA